MNRMLVLIVVFFSVSVSAQTVAPSSVVAIPVAASAQMSQAGKNLQQLLQPLRNLQGQFEQKMFDDEGELLQQSSGNFSLQQPGKFNWETLLPFEQSLISNGKKLWLYDPDLEQVTVKKVDESLQQTPALILTGNSELLAKNFRIEQAAIGEGSAHDGLPVQIFMLIPRADDPVFERLELFFTNAILTTLKVHDSLGQLTHFKLLNVHTNIELSADKFEFVIPVGTEIITDE